MISKLKKYLDFNMNQLIIALNCSPPGTEYFDGKSNRYVDFPITDVLQMMGRAGRPQYDDQGVAVILGGRIFQMFWNKKIYF